MDINSLKQLGKTLIKEYGLESSTNTLERWMLHYLAELFYKEKADTVIIVGTKGEPRTVSVIGHIELNKDGKTYPVNIYKN